VVISQHIYSASTTLPGLGSVNLAPKGGTLTLDEGWAPYGQAQLVIPLPDQATLDALDPRGFIRVTVTCAAVYGDMAGMWNPDADLSPVTRSFDLRLTGRRIQHKDATVVLVLCTDETVLQSYALVSTVVRKLSTTSAVTAVRDAMGLALPGVPLNVTANLANKPTETRRNLWTNPSVESGTAGFTANAATIARSAVAGGVAFGGFALSILPNNAGASAFVNIGGGDTGGMRAGLVAGKTYSLSATLTFLSAPIAPAAGIAGGFFVVFWKNAAATTYSESRAAYDSSLAGRWRIGTTFTLPPDTTEAFVRFYHPGRLATGQAPMYLDGILLEETDEIRPYFDGSFVNSPEVTYGWAGTAHASASTAVTRAVVKQAATDWMPGVSAWAYLASMLTAVGMRLFCDEQRVWRLVDSDYSVSGAVRISSGFNLVDAADDIARNNDETWFDAVVVKYTWTDADGNTRIEYDAAGSPGYQQARLIEMDAAYPGPGAAAYILRRAIGRGRVLALRGISDYSTQPGMEATATLPLSPVQSGYISAVTWDLSTDEMDVSTRGLTDTPATAWNQQPVGRRWQDIPAGVSWSSYTP
jgi:hypothetical protein